MRTEPSLHDTPVTSLVNDSPLTHHRVSWGAILAGVVVALAIQLLLNLLGIGIGASTITPTEGDTPGAGLAIGAGIWFAVSALISLWAGGWAAGRLAGTVGPKNGMLHGFTTWSLTTLLTFYLLTTTIGGILGGAASLLHKTASLTGEGTTAAAPMLGKLASQATGVTPDVIKQQAGDVATDPHFQAFATDMIRTGQPSAEDRNNLVQLVAQKQNISQQQADAEVTGWQQKFADAKQQATVKAQEAGDKAASGVTHAALWSFFALLLGALAATFGGRTGAALIQTDHRQKVSESRVR